MKEFYNFGVSIMRFNNRGENEKYKIVTIWEYTTPNEWHRESVRKYFNQTSFDDITELVKTVCEVLKCDIKTSVLEKHNGTFPTVDAWDLFLYTE